MIRRMFVGRSPSRGRDTDKPAWPKNNSRPNDRQAGRSSVEKMAEKSRAVLTISGKLPAFESSRGFDPGENPLVSSSHKTVSYASDKVTADDCACRIDTRNLCGLRAGK